jgi:hypothetical protein
LSISNFMCSDTLNPVLRISNESRDGSYTRSSSDPKDVKLFSICPRKRDSASSPLVQALVSTSIVTLPRSLDAAPTVAINAYAVSTAGITSSEPDRVTGIPLSRKPTRHPAGTVADQRNVAGPWNGRTVVGLAVNECNSIAPRHSIAPSSMSGTSPSPGRNVSLLMPNLPRVPAVGQPIDDFPLQAIGLPSRWFDTPASVPTIILLGRGAGPTSRSFE